MTLSKKTQSSNSRLPHKYLDKVIQDYNLKWLNKNLINVSVNYGGKRLLKESLVPTTDPIKNSIDLGLSPSRKAGGRSEGTTDSARADIERSSIYAKNEITDIASKK